MKRILQWVGALWFICVGITTGVYAAGHAAIGWPFNFFGFQALPTNGPNVPSSPNFDDDVFPPKVGAFTRAPFGTPNQDVRVLYSFKAQYFPPFGDPQRESVFVTATQFSELAEAGLLINPSDWRLHSATTNIFYALNPVPYFFKATDDGYHDYTIAFVSGRWNVTIECTNDQNLIAFANQYRR